MRSQLECGRTFDSQQGKRVWHGEIVPDGQLYDMARPGFCFPKHGDGPQSLHDWGVEYTAAGLVLQAELLLVSRDEQSIAHYLPLLRRCANFIETRRDPEKNLFLAGPADNLLAPNYAGPTGRTARPISLACRSTTLPASTD